MRAIAAVLSGATRQRPEEEAASAAASVAALPSSTGSAGEMLMKVSCVETSRTTSVSSADGLCSVSRAEKSVLAGTRRARTGLTRKALSAANMRRPTSARAPAPVVSVSVPLVKPAARGSATIESVSGSAAPGTKSSG